MDLAAFFAETAASIEASDSPEFPGFPVSRHPSGNGQVPEDKAISRVSRISRQEKGGNGFYENKKPQAGAGVRASVRTRDPYIEEREIREQREMPAGSDTYISRSLSRKREKERETGNSNPLPAALDSDEANERAAIMEFDGGLPRAEAEALARSHASRPSSLGAVAGWRAGLASLSASRIPCPGYTPEGWASVYDRALAFLDTFGDQAEALGWTTLRLFGVHPEAGTIRPDACGGLVLPIGGLVRAITAATISFGHLTHREMPGRPQGIPIWDFGR